jgi:hypothetical protein
MTAEELDKRLVEPVARAIYEAAYDFSDYDQYCSIQMASAAAIAAIAAMRAALKAEGLFVGPVVATEGMQDAMVRWRGGQWSSLWTLVVEEWQRGEERGSQD